MNINIKEFRKHSNPIYKISNQFILFVIFNFMKYIIILEKYLHQIFEHATHDGSPTLLSFNYITKKLELEKRMLHYHPKRKIILGVILSVDLIL